MDRVILHSDANCFYASVEMLHRPQYRNCPMAVGGDPKTRHGIVLTANYQAKRSGVKTGAALWEAKQACPNLVIVPPDYDQYIRFSTYLRSIYKEYTDLVEPFGLDECWLDLTHTCAGKRGGYETALEIRRRVKQELGITVSIGVSWNKIFAKFGSDYRKPDAVTNVTRERYKQIVWERPVSDLLYVGRATNRKLHNVGIITIGDLAQTDPAFLQQLLGKMGLTLSLFARGLDRTPVQHEAYVSPIKSVGNGMTMPYDLTTDEEVKVGIYMMAESVARRLHENGLSGRVIELYIRDKDLHGMTRQQTIQTPTNLSSEIGAAAYQIFRRTYRWEKPIRGLTVRVAGLGSEDMPYQINLFQDEKMRVKMQRMDRCVEYIRSRYGKDSVRRGMMAFGPPVTPRKAKEQQIHPMSYFQNGNLSGVYSVGGSDGI